MTTNMNFGPEWMRGSFPKHNHTTSATSNNNNNTSNFASSTTNENEGYSSSFDQQQQQESSSKQQQQIENNPFKYSKEFMLSLYKPGHQLPSDFKQHEYVTSTQDQCYAPLAFEELTEGEKKLLSGPVHSEVSQRRGDKTNRHHRNNNNNIQDYSPMQSPVNENGPNGGRLGQRKGRTGDYLNANKDQPSFKRGVGGNESDLLKRRDQGGLDDLNLSSLKLDHHQDEGGKVSGAAADWTSVGLANGLASASSAFTGSSGLFGSNNDSLNSPFKSDMLFGGTNDLTAGGGLSSLVPPAPGLAPAATAVKKPEETKWFYRDPSGQVQGPFEAQEMQDWYKAGFFTPTLMLRREDESVFEPLMVLTQKVGNDDQPFLQPRPSSSSQQTPAAPAAGVRSVDHLFGPPTGGGSDALFQSKYMPFGGNNVPTTPGGTLMDSFLNTSGSYSSPYNNTNAFTPGGSLLNNNRWDQSQPQPSPSSWLNPTSSPLGPFGGGHNQNVFGAAHSLNSPGVGSGLFDYNRPAENQLVDYQQQQYMNILQQNQQQRSMQFQQQFNQMQFPPASAASTPMDQSQQPQQPQQQQQQQQAFKNVVQLENFGGSNHASPVLTRPNLNAAVSQSGGWGSVPGTPVGDVPSSPWGSIVSTAIPTKVSEELQAKAPGAQSPRAPSSPNKKAIEKPIVKHAVVNSLPTPSSTPVVAPAQQPPVQQASVPAAQSAPVATQKATPAPAPIAPVTAPATSTSATGKVYSFADIQLEEQEMVAAAQAAASKKATAQTQAQAAQAQAAQATEQPQQQQTTKTAATPSVVSKPVVSLREIQQEELRIANEKKKQNKKAQISTPSWAASNSTPLSITNSGSWSQPSHKPLSLREIQELEAKEAAQKKKKESSAAEHLTQQQALANATPSTLSWGVVVPNNTKSSSVNSPTVSASSGAAGVANTNNSAAWTAPSGPKKTLREIQQEEELAMKKKNAKAVKTNTAAAVLVAASQAQAATPKAYATAPAGAGWTTVTSARAPKPATPVAPAAPAPVSQPTVIKPVQQKPVASRPSGPSEYFRRWCRKALRDLNSGVNQEEIIGMLISFPVDNNASEIIEDVIYANSLRIDGKRFAQEFMKRRKADLAGRYDIVTAGLNDQEEDPNDFKVVTTKKGKKKL